MKYHEFEEQCMKKIAATERVLDVGGGSRFQKGMKKYEALFTKTTYQTMDISADYSPDIIGDIHAIPLENESVDAIICRSVLERVQRPALAMHEMYHIFKPGGMLFVQVPSIYPYHARKGHGAYPDYWRFFEDSLRLMGQDFREVELVKRGGWFLKMSYFLPGQAKIRGFLDRLSAILDALFRTERRTNTAFYSVLYTK